MEITTTVTLTFGNQSVLATLLFSNPEISWDETSLSNQIL
jgi:hypothetical protein